MSSFMIVCANCGERPSSEFAFGGEAVAFPEDKVETLDENYDRVWLRVNVMGLQTERWFHYAGCRRWSTVERDTRTNAMSGCV
jgi:sarcosine oxidase subunit delta